MSVLGVIFLALGAVMLIAVAVSLGRAVIGETTSTADVVEIVSLPPIEVEPATRQHAGRLSEW